jgi:hypothetical protein
MVLRKVFLLLLLIMAALFSFGQGFTPAITHGKVTPYKGRPTIFINNQPQNPIIYSLTHVYTGRWSWEEGPARNLKNFAQIGFRLFQVDLYLEDIWYKDQAQLDIAKVQRQIRGVLDARADAAVFVRVHVNAPFWWNEQHPEECTQYANGPVDQREYGIPYNNEDGDVDRPLRASLASMRWREAATAKLVELCKRLAATPEGNAVAGLHISGGIYGEWHYWGFIEHDPDTGPAMTAYYRQWLKQKYGTNQKLQQAWNTKHYTFENATVPDTTERKFTSAGIFRNPIKEQRVIDYFRSQQEVVAEDIIHFCRIAKENWPRPLITGVFYGYFHMTFNRQATGGHLEIEKILNSPYIDYLSAPQSYYGAARALGGSGHSRGIVESALLHNKLWLDEMDSGEFAKVTDGIRTIRETNPDYIPVLRRNALHPLSRGTGLWYYDFGPRRTTGWWDVPEYLQNIKQEKDFFEKHLHVDYTSEADVLLVFDMKSFYYVKNGWTPVSEDLNDRFISELYHTGVVFDNIFLSDLDKVNLDQYKAIVFMNTFCISDQERVYIKNKVEQKGRHIVWNYLPGYTNGKDLNMAYVSDLTGMRVKQIDVAANPTVKVVASGFPTTEFSFRGQVYPLVSITDKNAQVLGKLTGTEHTVLARKNNPHFTSWYSTLPLHGPELMRKVLQEAGVHVYSTDLADVLYSGSGLLWIHTAEGGKRTIRLKNGKMMEIMLAPKSTTLYNNQTGEQIF